MSLLCEAMFVARQMPPALRGDILEAIYADVVQSSAMFSRVSQESVRVRIAAMPEPALPVIPIPPVFVPATSSVPVVNLLNSCQSVRFTFEERTGFHGWMHVCTVR